jgi:fucose permease
MVMLLVVIYIVFISLGLPDSVFGVAWPVLHKELGTAESFASVYSIIVGLCTSGVSVIAGKLLRRFGTGRVTLVSVLLTVIGLFGMSFAPNIAVMIVFAVVIGYGAGVIDTGLNNFVSLHYKAQHMNWLHCFWGVGVTLSPIIMSYFLREGSSWRYGYRTIGAIQASILIIVICSQPLWKKAENTPTAIEESGRAGEKSFFELIKSRGVLPSILSLAFYCGMEFLIGTWGASYLVHVFELSPSEASRMVSLYFGGIMLGRFVSGFLAMKLHDNRLIRIGTAFSALGMLMLILPLGRASVFGLLLIGTGFGPIFPSTLHAVPERFGKTYSADIIGFHMFGAYGIGFTIQLVFGYIATATTFVITPFVLLGIILCMLVSSETAIRKVGADTVIQ